MLMSILEGNDLGTHTIKQRCTQVADGSAIGAGAGSETLQKSSLDGPSNGNSDDSAVGFTSMMGLIMMRSPGGYSRACSFSLCKFEIACYLSIGLIRRSGLPCISSCFGIIVDGRRIVGRSATFASDLTIF